MKRKSIAALALAGLMLGSSSLGVFADELETRGSYSVTIRTSNSTVNSSLQRLVKDVNSIKEYRVHNGSISTRTLNGSLRKGSAGASVTIKSLSAAPGSTSYASGMPYKITSTGDYFVRLEGAKQCLGSSQFTW
ncbi:MAG: hypothetical protein ACRDD7_01840 [Peptostreptococcaceae bacterium]